MGCDRAMPRYHESGTICRAKKRCPLGAGDHFDSKEEAQQAREAKLQNKYGTFGNPSSNNANADANTNAASANTAAKRPTVLEVLGEERAGESGEGYMGGGSWKGSRSKLSFSNSDIAKYMRQDIKKLKEAGYIPPGTKISVTSDTYSVNIQAAVPSESDVPFEYNPVDYDDRGYVRPYKGEESMSHEVRDLSDALHTVHALYNHDSSNSMYDYFNKGYYGKAEVVSQYDPEYCSHEEIKAEKAYKRALEECRKASPTYDALSQDDDPQTKKLYRAYIRHQTACYNYERASELRRERMRAGRYAAEQMSSPTGLRQDEPLAYPDYAPIHAKYDKKISSIPALWKMHVAILQDPLTP